MGLSSYIKKGRQLTSNLIPVHLLSPLFCAPLPPAAPIATYAQHRHNQVNYALDTHLKSLISDSALIMVRPAHRMRCTTSSSPPYIRVQVNTMRK